MTSVGKKTFGVPQCDAPAWIAAGAAAHPAPHEKIAVCPVSWWSSVGGGGVR